MKRKKGEKQSTPKRVSAKLLANINSHEKGDFY